MSDRGYPLNIIDDYFTGQRGGEAGRVGSIVGALLKLHIYNSLSTDTRLSETFGRSLRNLGIGDCAPTAEQIYQVMEDAQIPVGPEYWKRGSVNSPTKNLCDVIRSDRNVKYLLEQLDGRLAFGFTVNRLSSGYANLRVEGTQDTVKAEVLRAVMVVIPELAQQYPKSFGRIFDVENS